MLDILELVSNPIKNAPEHGEGIEGGNVLVDAVVGSIEGVGGVGTVCGTSPLSHPYATVHI